MTSGAKGLVVYKNNILLYLRDNKPGIPYPNMWDMPGGGREEGESFEETARREIKEEFGVRPINIKYIGSEYYSGREAWRFICFLDQEEYEKIKLGDEGKKYKFFTLDEISNLNLIQPLKNFINNNREILKSIIENGAEIEPEKFFLANIP
ncbi:MAG: MutT/NUDIX family protein [Candidatus Amesbacteria bacterium GW2011_GWA1_47_16]|uniref:Nudix hydrolase domain-containing protein n=4 Tax=Candidatus Amesiibacteriota TaxID=1752730 RepID=A0A1F4ZYH8_9BACT|nr:MAG: MutT/NUDIX family protein [Candidatus Amesbacteria bacterium GW2011_GWC1_47_15]KKU64510.1 MAG: MutT/NUDIX family protein [Candidatus Amesbacteria bacterium GW2011_GWA1_47_16]OGD00383.1 MAG: hypothetical protein A2972_03900 [Candidatus Amesbacteria bacterium RIFCSPLOWO2_01_FULL_47_33]OGD00919.1 MAG: hypothetical protein A2701_04835 [Candidatus Amesbacteria bacterium RIFCSPHIGHO2_01_FULL_47_34]OGD10474.1 MAG: hypothetical protein A2395_01620 [Candidatus Amesbacteria bacterium RIFOXYB1_FUL